MYVENERPTGCNGWVSIAKLIVRSTCFGHQYARHQELKSLQMVAACGTWHCKDGKCKLKFGSIGVL
jgi:hypothetical protein